ncbi:MAG: prephenate dehydrogenase/arogenate dehydrogenase family protein [Chloroflexi bacterium]|nr:prephenate dehydrogenase/arogenate dehydrogenase family protein [Chloroflexota bacterium]
MQKITIVGLGLIGASLGLALKQANLSNIELVGNDINSNNASRAHKRRAVDRVEGRLERAVQGASLVIIATPVLAIREVLSQIAPHLPEGCIVTDTGSTKSEVMAWAREFLPESVSFVGGHPMAGKEESGPDAADANLFRGCVYNIVPSINATETAMRSILGLVDLVGARPFFVDAREHDGMVAAVSHLPLVASVALVDAVSGARNWREMSRLAATGFRDTTRLASGDPVMSLGICLTNGESISHWIDQLIESLQKYRDLLSNTDGKELQDSLARAWEARQRWIEEAQAPPQEAIKVEVPKASELASTLFFGESLTKRGEQVLKRWQESQRGEPEPEPKR